MARKSATQHDIARHLKVSRSTVAAVLRNDPKFSFTEATRLRVQQAARELDYQPHSSARALRGGRTHTLALAIPQFAAIGGAIQSQNLRGMGEAAQQMGYAVTICTYGTVRQMKPTFERLMRESRFDGVVMHGDDTCQDDPREKIVEEFGLPCVVLERRSPRSAWVDFDNHAGGAMATRHLIERGRHRVALIGAWYPQRREGYLDALREAGLPFEERLIWPRLSREPYDHVGRSAVEGLFAAGARCPDALFCGTDEIALAAIATLSERGLRVPEDVAVVGYDDSVMARYANPSLTSVRQDGVEMGRQAVRLLIQFIENPSGPVEHVVLEPTLTIRRSCGVCR